MGLPKKTRIVVIDDHVVVRRGVVEILKSESDFEVCGEASDREEAIEVTGRLKPRLALTDLTLPDTQGADIICDLRRASPETAVLVLTMHSYEDMVRAALKAGAQGYILKSEAASELIAAVRTVERGEIYLPPQLQEVLIGAFVNPHTVAAGSWPAPRVLSHRETQIIRLLAGGRSNKQVAAALGLSLRTIESHRYHIMRKMRFDSFSDLIRFALREHLAPT